MLQAELEEAEGELGEAVVRSVLISIVLSSQGLVETEVAQLVALPPPPDACSRTIMTEDSTRSIETLSASGRSITDEDSEVADVPMTHGLGAADGAAAGGVSAAAFSSAMLVLSPLLAAGRVGWRGRCRGAIGDRLRDGLSVEVVHDHLITGGEQIVAHGQAHCPQADQANPAHATLGRKVAHGASQPRHTLSSNIPQPHGVADHHA